MYENRTLKFEHSLRGQFMAAIWCH